MKFKGMKEAGFSLVELMVVVGIIGILAAIAVPKLQQFTAKAKQSEMRTELKSLDTMQQAYYAEQSTYGTDALVGFANPGGGIYATSTTANSNAAYTGTSTAAKICPQGGADTWTINQLSVITNTANGLTGC
ncbi:MAG: prepilin-type N-terminal cleavage/methylation domain-containing protein [bacterium]